MKIRDAFGFTLGGELIALLYIFGFGILALLQHGSLPWTLLRVDAVKLLSITSKLTRFGRLLVHLILGGAKSLILLMLILIFSIIPFGHCRHCRHCRYFVFKKGAS